LEISIKDVEKKGGKKLTFRFFNKLKRDQLLEEGHN
jgi:hypothetical protein